MLVDEQEPGRILVEGLRVETGRSSEVQEACGRVAFTYNLCDLTTWPLILWHTYKALTPSVVAQLCHSLTAHDQMAKQHNTVRQSVLRLFPSTPPLPLTPLH